MAKKIIIDGRALRLSTGRYTRKLLEYLQDVDKENTYIVAINEDDRSHWKPREKNNFSRVVVPYRHYSFGEQIGFAWFLYRQRADLVHFTMPQQPILYFKRSITTIHDLIMLQFHNPGDKNEYVYRIKQAIFKIFIKIIARSSNHILTVSKYSKTDIVNYTGVKPSKISVTYNAADKITAPAEEVGRAVGKKYLLYVGTGHTHKNLRLAVQAMNKLLERHPDLYIIFAGKKTAQYKELAHFARSLIPGRAYFPGFISDGKLRWLYEHATVYVFPSKAEGFGLPGLEAMQYGVPVAASNASCLPEVYQDAVVYFNPEDSTDMARAVHEILSSKQRADDLRAKAEPLLRQYSWKKLAEQTRTAYTKTLR